MKESIVTSKPVAIEKPKVQTKLNAQVWICSLYLITYVFILVARKQQWIAIDDTSLGMLTALVPAIIHFWIGSSHGSKVKYASK
jgi:hypothetical protein